MTSTPTRSHDVYFISDLHMSAGYNPLLGRYDIREDFFYAEAFGRLLDHIANASRQRGRPARLVMLGDTFEFLQVDGSPTPDDPLFAAIAAQEPMRKPQRFLGVTVNNGMGTSAAATMWRLEQIAKGHPAWFAAMGRFLAAHPDAQVDLVVGNHDVEIVWPPVQQRFRELVEEHSGGAAVGERIVFHEWFVYEPGCFYAEHGHQYDELNSFSTQLWPFLPHDDSLIELPLGSFFVRYIFNHIESRDSFADNLRPQTRYLIWVLTHHPLHSLVSLFYYLYLVGKVLRKTSKLTPAERQARIEHYRCETLPSFAANVGLDLDQVVAIDRLARTPSMETPWQQVRDVLVKPLGELLLIAGPLVAAFGALRRARRSVRYIVSTLVGTLALLWRERTIFSPPIEPPSHLRDMARQIDAVLRHTAYRGVPFYVFGHSHVAEVFPLHRTQMLPRYFNAGTWTPVLETHLQHALHGDVQLALVRLQFDDDTAQGDLLHWNDTAERLDRVPLI